MVYKSNRR